MKLDIHKQICKECLQGRPHLRFIDDGGSGVAFLRSRHDSKTVETIDDSDCSHHLVELLVLILKLTNREKKEEEVKNSLAKLRCLVIP